MAAHSARVLRCLLYRRRAHKFDDIIVELFHVAKMLSFGGALMLHDNWMPSVQKVQGFIEANVPSLLHVPNPLGFKCCITIYSTRRCRLISAHGTTLSPSETPCQTHRQKRWPVHNQCVCVCGLNQRRPAKASAILHLGSFRAHGRRPTQAAGCELVAHAENYAPASGALPVLGAGQRWAGCPTQRECSLWP